MHGVGYKRTVTRVATLSEHTSRNTEHVIKHFQANKNAKLSVPTANYLLFCPHSKPNSSDRGSNITFHKIPTTVRINISDYPEQLLETIIER